MSTRRLALLAALTAGALTVFVIEAQIPVLAAVPGVKLGLANVFTLFAVYMLGRREALALMVCRVVLGCVICGQIMAMAYSLAGGLLCWVVMSALKGLVPVRQAWVVSIFGAIAHNIGQLAVAAVVCGTAAVFAYLPALMVSAIITGAFTGLCACLVMLRLNKQWPSRGG